jgi:hypothetical protein
MSNMDISQLIKSIDLVTSSGSLETADPQQLAQLSQACDRLKSRCETPLDKTLRLSYTVTFQLPRTKLSICGLG